ncbi:MAG: ATP-binding protein, partial [Nitrococcus sp.]|nr:ATP-binding protein [Nitrococcus sp.]
IGSGREVTALHSSGETFPIALSIGEALSDGRHRFVGNIRDLRAKRTTELNIRSLEARLAWADRLNLMGEMAAGIAHEINQPLSAIATYAQALGNLLRLEPPDVEVAAEICEKIDAQARRAGQVTQSVRNLIRQHDVSAEIVDVNRVIADVRNLIEADARAAGIRIVVRYDEGLPPVRADALQLQQVVLNLTRNALDTMRGELYAHGDIIVETVRAAAGGVRITVTDHGPGVSRALADNIFYPFVTTKENGLGVGLAISRTIIQAHGGTLSFGDNPEGGAIFTIDLPAADDGATT